jgi:DNA mismatch repair protein MutL
MILSVTPPTTNTRIHRLDNRLANQIAAGEVVDRPASVVKELLENSIDALATKVEVEIERGGTRLIRVTDNGCGIIKDDLGLALSRHATSKISQTADLAAINSLGFRGEALASIASVSKLCLTSRTKDSEYAWQAIAEGRDMAVDIQPASATVGTRIEVRDLFYNTPARQKFLRTEKTEFSHIEEIFKRHALANANSSFVLKHNQKIIKRVPASSEQDNGLKRIENICGKPFADNAVFFSCLHEVVNIKGWLGIPSFHRSESDIQYVFINGRPVKDKMLNHAIRQSYQGLLPPGRMPAYVLFITIDPNRIDVNVHPTKHEVRFDEQRTIHDLLVKSISDTIADCQSTLDLPTNHRAEALVSQPNQPASETDSSDLTNKPSIHSPTDNSYRTPRVHASYSSQAINQAARKILDKNTSSAVTGPDLGLVPDLGLASELDSNKSSINETSCSHYLNNNTSQNNNLLNGNYSNETVSMLTPDGSGNGCWRFKSGVWLFIDDTAPQLIDEKKLFEDFMPVMLSADNEQTLIFQSLIFQPKPLLFPTKVEVDFEYLEDCKVASNIEKVGFSLKPLCNNQVEITAAPYALIIGEQISLTELFLTCLKSLQSNEFEKLYDLLSPLSSAAIVVIRELLETNNVNSQAIKLLQDKQVERWMI